MTFRTHSRLARLEARFPGKTTETDSSFTPERIAELVSSILSLPDDECPSGSLGSPPSSSTKDALPTAPACYTPSFRGLGELFV